MYGSFVTIMVGKTIDKLESLVGEGDSKLSKYALINIVDSEHEDQEDESLMKSLQDPEFIHILHGDLFKKNTFTCNVCQTYFFRREHLNRHQTKHTFNKCDTCKNQFKSKNKLNKHKSMNQNCNILPTCKICFSIFKIDEYLRKHMIETHLNERPHQCNICQKCFKRTTHLSAHMSVHSTVNHLWSIKK